jgi:general stress protein YciG
MAERGEGKSKRGFASMDRERQREIASKGGRAAHAKGTAHEFNSDEARAAGRKGGEVVSRNREHMAEIGRKGGEARGSAARQASGRGAGAGASASRGTDEHAGGLSGARSGESEVDLRDISGGRADMSRGDVSGDGATRGGQGREQGTRGTSAQQQER